VYYQSSGAAATTGAMFVTSDAGATWSTSTGRAMLYEVWGVYRTETVSDVTRATYLLAAVRVGTNARLELSLPLANRPVVTP
jgi:hypothetical protein